MTDDLYIDLFKKTLTDYHKIGYTEYKPLYKNNDSWQLKFMITLDKIFRKNKLAICKYAQFDVNKRIEGKDWPANADSMIGLKRLDNIEYCFRQIIKDNIQGDFIETGVWRGGATIFMKALLKSQNINDRLVWVADSFEGLPKPNVEKYKEDKGDIFHTYEELAIPLETVQNNFRKYDLLDENVKFLKGWFKDTLPTAPIDKLSLIRLDGDMYESTMDGLVNLYPKLTKGGFIIIDDWGAVKACKQAVLDYREQHNITDEIKIVDWTGAFWRKES